MDIFETSRRVVPGMNTDVDDPSCIVCGRPFGERHHIQYTPKQVIAYLCTRCHGLVHADNGIFDDLRPDEERESLPAEVRHRLEREYRRGDYDVVTDPPEDVTECGGCDRRIHPALVDDVERNYHDLRYCPTCGSEL